MHVIFSNLVKGCFLWSIEIWYTDNFPQLNGEKEQLKAQHNLSEISLLSCLHFTTTLIMMLSPTWIFMNHEFMITIIDIP
jgi:hypothetical protein